MNRSNETSQIILPNTLIISICYLIIEVFGLCGNILVIITVYIGRRRFQTNYYRLVFHLAICDTLLLLAGNFVFSVGPWMADYYQSNSQLKTVMCVIISPLVGCLAGTELGILILIAFLRYKVITQPLEPKLSGEKLQYIIALIHIVPLFLGLPKFLSQQLNTAKICTNKWEDNIYFYIYGSIINLGITLISMILLFVLYAKMCYSLALHQKNLKRLFSPETTNLPDDPARIATSHQHLRVEKNTKMLTVSIVVVAQFLISFAAVTVLGRILWEFGLSEFYKHLAYMMPVYFLVSCAFNPIVYGIGDKKIREGYKTTLRKIYRCK